MKILKRIISSALVFTIMASFTVFGTKAEELKTTDFITSDTDIDAILKTPYVDAVPTAFSELAFATHSQGYGFDANSILRTGASIKYDMQIDLSVNGNKIKPDSGNYYPSHTALSSDIIKTDNYADITSKSTVSATYSFDKYTPDVYICDGIIDYTNAYANRWATWRSPNESDTLTFDFGNSYDIDKIDMHYYTDGGGTQYPTAVKICYFNGTEYVEVPKCTYPDIVSNGATVYTFDKVTTSSITVTLTCVSGKGMGVTEAAIYGNPSAKRVNFATTAVTSASYSYNYYTPEYTVDRNIAYSGGNYNRWATWRSGHEKDWLEYDFGREMTPDTVNVHFFTDSGGTQLPSAVELQYWNGEEFVAVPDVSAPAEFSKTAANTFTFPAVKTSKMRVVLTNLNYSGNKYCAVTEVEIYGNSDDYYNVAVAAEIKSSITPKYGAVTQINDGIIGYYNAVNNRWNTYVGGEITKTSTVDFLFESTVDVEKIAVYPFDETTPYGSKTAAAAQMVVPESVTFQYLRDGVWTDIENISGPTAFTPGRVAVFTFPQITASAIRATVNAQDGKTTGITELEIYGKPVVAENSPYNVTVSEEKFITTDNVVTSVIKVTNNDTNAAEVILNVTNTRGAISEQQDGMYVVMNSQGATEMTGGFSNVVMLKADESCEFISTLAFAKTEADAKANAQAVVADENRLENHKASYLAWFKENVPFFECDDPQITQTYYFRWLTYRNNIRLLPTDKYLITEFMPNVGWAGAYNSIVGDVPHHLYEGRWIKNSEYIEDYKDFWFETDGVKLTGYTNAMSDAYLAYYLTNGDKDALTKHLDNLISVYNTWENKTSSENAYFDADTGLYFVKNGYDAMEYSLSYKIGGTDAGYRPTVNSDMYGDALAIAQIATLAGKTDIAERYFAKAETLKASIQDKMWNAGDGMFETYDLGDGDTIGVKELVGYLPWYYNMPDDTEEYGKAWQYLADENTFYGVYGLTTGDKSHPDYNTYYTDKSLNRSGNCNWDGSSWPFGTTSTLVAAANALNNYENAGLTADDYYKALKAYTNGQFKNGYSWIAENRDADEDKWYIDHASRSYHYNHSAYADLIITGLVGIRPADNDDTVVINPLVPENTLSSFVLENVEYRGNNLTVVYDKTGDTYGVGKGLTVYVNGEVAKTADTISKQTVVLATHEHDIVTVEAKAPTYTSVGWNEYEYCTVCDYTTYKEIEMLEVPSVSCDDTTATLSGDGARRVYWGCIGSENTEYKWFNDFKAQCGDTFTSEFNPKADDKYLLDKNGYYRFVVNYIDDNGKSVDRVFTFESQGQDVAVPAVTVDGNYAVITTDGAEVNKLYYGYIGTENTAYTGFDRSVLTEADFNVKNGDSYLLNKAGYYRFVVNYKQGDRLVDKVYTVKVETDGGVPDVIYADGKVTLSTNGVKVNKLYLAYNGEETVEVTSWADYCEKAIARVCYQTPADESEYTLANSGCYTVLVNYFDGNKNVDKYFTINN